MSLFGKKKKILVVEDDTEIAEGLKARLELENFAVSLAPDGDAGMRAARHDHPDLIILDVMMPKVNGYDACKALKNDPKTQRIPILILTALPQLRDAELAFDAGADDFLNKPYSNDRLIQKVTKLFSKSDQRPA